MTVQELESKLTGSEYQEWLIYDRFEPFGAVRDDWRIAYMLAVIANMIRDKNSPPFNPMDFAPDSVHSWLEAINAAGQEREEMTREKSPRPIPKSREMMIFDEMMKDHMKG